MYTCGLRDKNRCQREVQSASVEIEAIAGGKHKGNNRTRNTKGLEGFHGGRQSGLGGRSTEGNGHGLSYGRPKTSDWHLDEEGDRQQDTEDEHKKCDVEGCQELGKVCENS